ncbi:MAG: TonB-dependent receptor [Candidatus Aminicenantes bacterium]|nr:MAG: TonB-dependent receptor [Candidatus Aminicenantes bacterium]
MNHRVVLLLATLMLFLFVISPFSPHDLIAQEKEKEKEETRKQKQITEEIVVEADRPQDVPLSTTSLILKDKIEALQPRNLADVLSYSSGTFVSTGAKNEFRLKIRGFEGQRIVLLYDGIPIYEPFFNSFDLKTIPTEEIESIKIVKGASSVLYGPNAMGGIVNVITRRPVPPSFSLTTSYNSQKAFNLASTGSIRWDKIFFSGFLSYDKSEGFKWSQDGSHTSMDNSDYDRLNFVGKVYFYPNEKSEILFEASYYTSSYGIPSATEYYKPRYWRFKDWNRWQFNLGGTFAFFKRGNLKVRSYYVRHFNVLNAYTGPDFNDVQWESTYKNDSYGAFLLGSLPFASQNEWKFSLNFRDDKVRMQDDIGEAWEKFQHQTVSVGLESRLRLNPKWRLVVGASLDHLRKFTGENKISLNPIAGLNFNPSDYVDLRVSVSQKSRFPSMRSLYSSQGGNPDLKHERGTSYELGFLYEKDFMFSGAVFYNKINDLIQSVRLIDGSRTNLNIGQAYIAGFEIEFSKAFRWLDFSLNYTFLDGVNEDEDRPLDLVPESQLNFIMNAYGPKNTKFALSGLYVSSTEVKIFDDIVRIPGYFVLNAVFSVKISKFDVFLKVENLLDNSYVTEPGYPMKARTLALGFRMRLSQIQ